MNNKVYLIIQKRIYLNFLLLPLLLGATFTALASVDAHKNWHHILILNDINGAYGEIGYSPEIQKVISESIETWQVKLVISPGDLIAGQSLKLTKQNIENMWQGFKTQVLLPFQLSDIPFAASFGNHDGSKYQDNKQNDTQEYKYVSEREIAKFFWLKNKAELNYLSQNNYPFFYSFDFANTLFVMIDASGFQMSKQEFLLIENMLKANDVNKRIIVVGHLPLTGIAINRNKFGEVIESSTELMSLFQQYDVDMYISGHQHVYYPALHQGVILLNSGGTPPRALVDQEKIANSCITVLSINADDQQFFSTTYNLKDLTKLDESKILDKVKGYPFDLNKTVIRSNTNISP